MYTLPFLNIFNDRCMNLFLACRSTLCKSSQISLHWIEFVEKCMLVTGGEWNLSQRGHAALAPPAVPFLLIIGLWCVHCSGQLLPEGWQLGQAESGHLRLGPFLREETSLLELGSLNAPSTTGSSIGVYSIPLEQHSLWLTS